MEYIGICIVVVLFAFISYAVYKLNKDSKTILIKGGTWLLLRPDYDHDIYDNKNKYIRIVEDYTKSNDDGGWNWCLYEYFEPDGEIKRETISHPLEKYDFATYDIAKKLNTAYYKQLHKQLEAKHKMQDEAFKAFTK